MNPKTSYCKPGEILVTTPPGILTTVLGSCVSVCLYDHDHQIAAMNHYLFPVNTLNHNDIGKYGDSSIKKMIQMVRSQIGQMPLFAKVFGGSSIHRSSLAIFNTGEKNCEIAKQVLRDSGIEIISEDLGGRKGRKIDFETSTSTVIVKYLATQTYE